MADVVNTLGRAPRGSDQVWWVNGTYYLTTSARRPPVVGAQWLGRLDRGVYTSIWLGLEKGTVQGSMGLC
jgi:hypothetical protein